MRQPKKPLWIEGLFLEPHHFQRQDLYHEQLLARRLGAVVPSDWGVVDLEIDRRSLQTGELRVARLEGILPDGTCVSAGDGTADRIPPRQFRLGAQGAGAPALDVYVGLAQEGTPLANVDLKNDPAATSRYLRAQSAVPDYNTGTDERSVDWASCNLRLLFGDEKSDRFDVLHVARITRSPSGAVVLDDAFVPPALHIQVSGFLTREFRRVYDAVLERQRQLSSSRRQRSKTVVEFPVEEASKFWLLHTLNGILPALSEVVDKPKTSPREAYGVLAELLGQLCTFDGEIDPTHIPRFNTLSLGEVFAPMFASSLKILERVFAERYVEIPLEVQSGFLVGQLRDPAILQYAFYIAATGSYSDAQLREHFPKLTKIASLPQMPMLLHSHVNGVRVMFEHRPPAALPMKPGVTFFRVDTTNDFWTQIVVSGTFAIHAPFDPKALQLALYAVDPTTA